MRQISSNNRDTQFYGLLLTISSIIHRYGIGDESYFQDRFPDIDKSILHEIWKRSSEKEKVIVAYPQLSKTELNSVESQLRFYKNNNAKILDRLSSPIPKLSVNLSVESELRRQLAIIYISSATYSIHNKLGIPESFLRPDVRQKRQKELGIFIVLAVLAMVALYFYPRIKDGFTPVEKLAQEYYEESRYKFSGAICRDGWISSSSGRGTCSHHGGVWKYFKKGDYSQTYEQCLQRARERSWFE